MSLDYSFTVTTCMLTTYGLQPESVTVSLGIICGQKRRTDIAQMLLGFNPAHLKAPKKKGEQSAKAHKSFYHNNLREVLHGIVVKCGKEEGVALG